MIGSGNRLTPGERKLRNEMFIRGQLWCADCKQFLPIKDFWKSLSKQLTNYGYRFYCIKCENLHKRADKSIRKIYHRKRIRERKAKVVNLMGAKCQRCGYSSVPAMDFHHVYPSEKQHTPTALLYSKDIEGAWVELDKCCMLCRNCHIEYTAGIWRKEFLKRDGLGWTVGDDLPLDDNRYEAKKAPIYRQAPLPEAYYPEPPLQLSMEL